jgi:hypothetical protein
MTWISTLSNRGPPDEQQTPARQKIAHKRETGCDALGY